LVLEKETGNWLIDTLETLTPASERQISFGQLKADFELYFEDFELFWYSKPINKMKELGLLAL
jgi:hypothetical protein